MSAYDMARNMSVGILTYVGATKWVSYMVGDNPYDKKLPWKVLAHILPVRIFEDGFFTSRTITTVATRVQNNTAAHETPYVWARKFLEEAGFNLTERIPAILGVHEYEIPGVDCRHDFLPTHLASAVTPNLIHELSSRWTFTLIGNISQLLLKTIGKLDMVGLAWLLAVLLVSVLLFLWRCDLMLMSWRVWEELKEDVETFAQQKIGPDSKELPAGTITISAADVEILKASANAIEKRINYLRMSKFNFVRGRTGIVFNLNTFRKLQIQLTKAQEAVKKEKAAKARPLVKFVRSRRPGVVFYSHTFAKLQNQLAEARKALEEEKAGHQGTRDFLDHQTNARANAEEELEELRARLETEEPEEEEENPQLETIEEAEEESPAADEAEFQPIAEEEDPKLDTQLENSEESEEEVSTDQMGSQPECEGGTPSLSTQLEGNEKSEENLVAEAADSEHDAEEETAEINTQLETIEESEAESPPEQIDAQADLTAEDEDNADKTQIKRLQVQLHVEQANYRSVFQRKEVFRHGGKKLKKELEDLQAEYNMLEDSRDTWKETCEALEKQTDVKAVRALRDQIASDNAHNERRIEALETQLGFERTNREEAQNIARELRESVKKLKDELEEAVARYENLQTSYEELDNMHGAEERANEDKDDEISDLKAEHERLEARFAALNERYVELNADRTGAAETGAAETGAAEEEDESQRKDKPIFQQPEGSKVTNVEEGAPLRRIQSAPLWLPLAHHGDTFDHMYDVSDYGDDDRDREDGDEDRNDDEDDRDDKPDSGNDDRDGASEDDKNNDNDDAGPNEDDKDDDDDPDDGRDGGADKVATDADLAQEDVVVKSPGVSGDIPSSKLPLKDGKRPTDLQTPDPSPPRIPSKMNGSAIEFVPSVRPKRPVPPLLPHHQAYTASQQGVNSSNSSSGSASPLPTFKIHSAANRATLLPEVSVRGSIQNQYPFPEIYDSTVPMHNELPAHTPAPKAAGPAEAKNAHIQKLNEEVKRLDWRRKSGMPDLVEDEEGVTVPDVVLGKIFLPCPLGACVI